MHLVLRNRQQHVKGLLPPILAVMSLVAARRQSLGMLSSASASAALGDANLLY